MILTSSFIHGLDLSNESVYAGDIDLWPWLPDNQTIKWFLVLLWICWCPFATVFVVINVKQKKKCQNCLFLFHKNVAAGLIWSIPDLSENWYMIRSYAGLTTYIEAIS